MGIGPVFAVPKLLQRARPQSQTTSIFGNSTKRSRSRWSTAATACGIDPEKLNVNGGSISIGHPFGMTGSRMVGTLANEMARRKARYGVVTMCIGGGQGAAGLFESAN